MSADDTMTEDDGPYDRRLSDKRIDELEEAITVIVNEAVQKHKDKDHYPLTHDDITQMITEFVEDRKVSKRVVEMLEGKPIRGLSGHIIAREDGLMQTAQKTNAMVMEIDRRTNGGITVTQKIQWTPKAKVAAWAAFGAFLTQTFAVVVLLFM
jgi:hypothetical protein